MLLTVFACHVYQARTSRLYQFITHFGVWCNASIRVLGTRGDSSILSSPTKVHRWSNGLRHGVANAEIPVRIRYDAPNVFAPVAQWKSATLRTSRLRVQVLPGVPISELKILAPPPKARSIVVCATCGSDVAGNMRVFQTRLESSNLSFRTICTRRQAAKARDCKSRMREFESHRVLQILNNHEQLLPQP